MSNLNLIARPIAAWPGEKTPGWKRKHAPFRAGWSDTVERLERELGQLGARTAVLEMQVSESDIRSDGWIRSTARPSEPGVILSFSAQKGGSLRFPCDAFHAWEDNVRAIALGLEALRKVERYGITKRAEQYAGWKAIPSSTSSTMTAETAATHLENMTGIDARLILRDRSTFENARRIALSKAHPDAGGTDALFIATQGCVAAVAKVHAA